jgi:hypothetical protein
MSLPSLRATSLAVLLASSTLGLAACSDTPEPKTANVKSGAMPEGESWTGVYFHPVFGYLHMQEEGSNVVGRWKRTDHSHWGELSGTTSGNLLHYTWKEHKIGMVGASATTHGRGYFVYPKTDDMEQAQLKGEYGLGRDETGSEWNMVKQARMQPDLKSIGGDTGGSAPVSFPAGLWKLVSRIWTPHEMAHPAPMRTDEAAMMTESHVT